MVKGRRKFGPRGLTLIELLVVSATVGIVFTLVAVIVRNLSDFFMVTEAKSTVQSEARLSLEQIVSRLRESSASGVVIDSAPGQPPYSRIKIPTTPAGSFVIYRQEGSRLIREENGNSFVMSLYLRSLIFTYPTPGDPTYVGISLSMEKNFGRGGRSSYDSLSDFVQIMNP